MDSNCDNSPTSCPTVHFKWKSFKRPEKIQRRYKSMPRRKTEDDDEKSSDHIVMLISKRTEDKVPDEIELQLAQAKQVVAKKKVDEYNETMNKNTQIGEMKSSEKCVKTVDLSFPRWYQELSYDQTNCVMTLEDAILNDRRDNVTTLTYRNLKDIGIISPYVKFSAKTIFRLHRKAAFKAVDFLREIYKEITGNYFEEEKYKKYYNCNERLVLTSIAALALPEVTSELHKRVPMPVAKLPEKPKAPTPKKIVRNPNPYFEEIRPVEDWRVHRSRWNQWKDEMKATPKPRLIKPPLPKTKDIEEYCLGESDDSPAMAEKIEEKSKIVQRASSEKSKKKKIAKQRRRGKFKTKFEPEEVEKEEAKSKCEIELEKYESMVKEVEFKPEIEEPKSEHISEAEPLDLEESSSKFKKCFPAGREHLSLKMRDFLGAFDHDFRNLSKTADDLIKKVEKQSTFLNRTTCDDCCASRQMAKKEHAKKHNPEFLQVIDSIVEEDGGKKKEIISTLIGSPIGSTCGDDPPKKYVENVQVFSPIVNNLVEVNGSTSKLLTGSEFYEDQLTYGGGEKKLKNAPSCDCMEDEGFEETAEVSSKVDELIESDEGISNVGFETKELTCTEELRDKPASGSNSELDNKLHYNYDDASDILGDILITNENLQASANRCDSEMSSYSFKLHQYKRCLLDKTIVHLVDRTKPGTVSEYEPPCKCRENRNNTKQMLPGIEGAEYIKDDNNKKTMISILDGSLVPLTPLPSKYNSSEYIPDYELEPPVSYINHKADCQEERRLTDVEIVRFFTGSKNGVPCAEHELQAMIPRKILLRKPACECVANRKSVRELEEREWREKREQRLQTYEKKPIMKISGVDRPLEVKKVPVVSGVREIHTADGKIKPTFCVAGIAEVTSVHSLVRVMSDINLHTPFETPTPSEIVACQCSKKDKICDQCDTIRETQSNLNEDSESRKQGRGRSKRRMTIKSAKSRSRSKLTEEDAKGGKKGSELKLDEALTKRRMTIKRTYDEDTKERRKLSSGSNKELEKLQQQIEEEKDNELLKNELATLKDEGFVFAKLPACETYPLLRVWWINRKGKSYISPKEKVLEAEGLFLKGNTVFNETPLTTFAPVLEVHLKKIKKHTYDQAEEFKKKINETTNKFFSQILQGRVDRARQFWNIFDFVKFPMRRFKETFFTYMPGPEKSAYVFRPKLAFERN